MASLRRNSSNRFASLEDDEDDLSSPERADTALRDLTAFRKEYEKRLKEITGEGRPFRRAPKSVQRSSRRVRKSLQGDAQELPLAKLCATCGSIFNQERSEDWLETWHDHHQSQLALDEAVKMGCTICKLINKSPLAQAMQTDLARPRLTVDDDHSVGLQYRVDIDYTLLIGSSATRNMYLASRLVLIMLKSEDVDSLLPRTQPSPSTAADQTWDLCRYWLHTCLTRHRKCGHREKDSTFRPSRLIHVEGSGNGTIRARLDCEMPTKGRSNYLTLSHCWGTNQFFTLCKKNLSQLQKRIACEELPKAFQDAFFTTLKLGFNYIWIDSLCIVQDSPEDWLYESERMGEIYKHSSCNIAATGFADGGSGFFVSRDQDSVICHKVHAEWKGDWPSTDEPLEGFYYLLEKDIWENQVSQAPLNRRGWVVQERLLSPCVLHFGNRQLFWECFESHQCETFPSGFPPSIMTSTDFKTILFFEDMSTKETSSDRGQFEHRFGPLPTIPTVDESGIYGSWHEIVEAYSIGQLTQAEDKLLAISGAAKQIRHILKDRYLAGLWERNFLRDLLWQVSHDSDVGLTLLTYRAPTWSWASLDAGVSYMSVYGTDSDTEEFHAALKHVELTYATEDDTGLVTGGRVFIEGLLLQARLPGQYSTTFWHREYIVSSTKIKLDVSLDLNRKNVGGSGSGFSLKRDKHDVFQLSLSDNFKEHFLRNQSFYILPIRTATDLETKDLEVSGLVLIRTGCDRGEYIRVGMFVAESEEATTAVTTPALQSDPDLWEEDCGNGRYLITIA